MELTNEDLYLRETLAALPSYSPSLRFNAKVMKALGFEIRPAFNWTLLFEKTLAIIAACWLAGACFIVLGLLFAHAGELFLLCAEPQALISALKLYALKAWLAGSKVISLLSKAAEIILFFAGKADLLPNLAVSSILAALTITTVLRPSVKKAYK